MIVDRDLADEMDGPQIESRPEGRADAGEGYRGPDWALRRWRARYCATGAMLAGRRAAIVAFCGGRLVPREQRARRLAAAKTNDGPADGDHGRRRLTWIARSVQGSTRSRSRRSASLTTVCRARGVSGVASSKVMGSAGGE